jgi:DNA-binding GntR family transcriptional regulator
MATGGPPRRSLRDRAYHAIRAAILEGDLRPGSAISEAERAENLGVSRTPIREALQLLAREGLVEVFPKRGTLVARLSARDVRESFELREAIEAAAARLAAQRRTKAELGEMKAALRRQRNRPRDDGYLSAADFHRIVVAAAHNHYLLEAFDSTAGRIDLASRMAARVATDYAPDATHEAVLAAIEAGDAESAERAMHAHLHHHASSLLEELA